MSLTQKQEAFVAEYLVDLNATAAAERARYEHPNKQGPRMLVNVGIAKASCQRHTQVFDLPVRRMISIVPQPAAVRSMIRARQTCFWGVFLPAMMSESRL